jgi:hypothetical protein
VGCVSGRGGGVKTHPLLPRTSLNLLAERKKLRRKRLKPFTPSVQLPLIPPVRGDLVRRLGDHQAARLTLSRVSRCTWLIRFATPIGEL